MIWHHIDLSFEDECGNDYLISEEEDFVVGGDNTEIHYPWMGSLGHFRERDNNVTWFHRCGVTIISEVYAISAAHCLHDIDTKE